VQALGGPEHSPPETVRDHHLVADRHAEHASPFPPHMLGTTWQSAGRSPDASRCITSGDSLKCEIPVRSVSRAGSSSRSRASPRRSVVVRVRRRAGDRRGAAGAPSQRETSGPTSATPPRIVSLGGWAQQCTWVLGEVCESSVASSAPHDWLLQSCEATVGKHRQSTIWCQRSAARTADGVSRYSRPPPGLALTALRPIRCTQVGACDKGCVASQVSDHLVGFHAACDGVPRGP
jgi:hypothetical protein